MRSRFLFIFLFLASLSITPLGVYTCFCLVPVEERAAPHPQNEIADQNATDETAAASLLGLTSIAFTVAAVLVFVIRRNSWAFALPAAKPPLQFCQPPPTPPPAFT